jgi:threonine dehydrogenase-like Zn-dependent dehydrogenase
MSQRTMRAAVLAGHQEICLAETAVPEPGPGEVRVRLVGCGICASNLPVWEGRPWFDYPRPAGTPGHEGWGYVEALGSGVRDLAEGDPVTLLSYAAFAEYDVAPAANVVKLPAAWDGQPAPGEPLGCAINVFRRSGITAGQTVAIVGIGFLGALLTSLASQAGARVIAVSRRPFALAIARQCGAVETVAIPEDDTVADTVAAARETVQALTNGEGCHCVIEATGKQQPLDLAAELTQVRGRLIIAGYHQDGQRQVNLQLWNWRGLDVINAHERDPQLYIEGMQAAITAVTAGYLNPQPLYTHTYSLDQIGEGFNAAQSRPDGFMKALILC